jgi:NDP-sugar pyrophosphorylase family protein
MTTELVLTPAELEMIELKRKENALAQEKLEIERKITYDKNIQSAKNDLDKQIKDCELRNKNITNLYDSLVDLNVGSHVSLIESTKQLTASTWYNDKLEDKDKIQPVEFKIYSINLGTWGTIYDCTNDLKAQLPFTLCSRYQAYTAKTIAVKIKEKIAYEESQVIINNKLNIAKNTLKQYFKTIDSGCTIEEKEKWIYPSNRGKGYSIDTLVITFSNTSSITIRYYGDASWSILEKFDHKAPKTKEDWVNYLAS